MSKGDNMSLLTGDQNWFCFVLFCFFARKLTNIFSTNNSVLTQGKGYVKKHRSQRRKRNTVELAEVGVGRNKIPDQMPLSTSEIG